MKAQEIFNQQKEYFDINIYSIEGKLVKQFTELVFDSRRVIDLSDIPNGAYFIQFKNN